MLGVLHLAFFKHQVTLHGLDICPKGMLNHCFSDVRLSIHGSTGIRNNILNLDFKNGKLNKIKGRQFALSMKY